MCRARTLWTSAGWTSRRRSVIVERDICCSCFLLTCRRSRMSDSRAADLIAVPASFRAERGIPCGGGSLAALGMTRILHKGALFHERNRDPRRRAHAHRLVPLRAVVVLRPPARLG